MKRQGMKNGWIPRLLVLGTALFLGLSSCDVVDFILSPNGYLGQVKQMGVSERVMDWMEFPGEAGIGLATWETEIYVITTKAVYRIDEESLQEKERYTYAEGSAPPHYNSGEMAYQRQEQWLVRPHEIEGNIMMINSRTGEIITLSQNAPSLAVVSGTFGNPGGAGSLFWDTGLTETRMADWDYDHSMASLSESTAGNYSTSLTSYNGFSPYDWRLVNSYQFNASVAVGPYPFLTALCFAPTRSSPGPSQGPYGVLILEEGTYNGATGTYNTPFYITNYDQQSAGMPWDDGGYMPAHPRFCVREPSFSSANFRFLLQINGVVYLYEGPSSGGEPQRVDAIPSGENWMFELSDQYIFALQRAANPDSAVLVKMPWGGK